jgi:hypothetical protein
MEPVPLATRVFGLCGHDLRRHAGYDVGQRQRFPSRRRALFFQRTLQITHAFGDGGNAVKCPPILGPLRVPKKKSPTLCARGASWEVRLAAALSSLPGELGAFVPRLWLSGPQVEVRRGPCARAEEPRGKRQMLTTKSVPPSEGR